MSDDVIVLNDYSGVLTEQRERKGGKQYVTVSIKADPIAVNLDEKALARPVADAIAETIREQTRAITWLASKATLAARKVAAKAYAAGESWAQKRYSGGRMGGMPPNQSDKLFNDSGRLAAGITVNQNPKAGTWTINAPANRFVAANFKAGQMEAMIERWIDLVPALRNPLEQARVKETLANVRDAMFAKLKQQNSDLRTARLKAGLNLFRQVVGV